MRMVGSQGVQGLCSSRRTSKWAQLAQFSHPARANLKVLNAVKDLRELTKHPLLVQTDGFLLPLLTADTPGFPSSPVPAGRWPGRSHCRRLVVLRMWSPDRYPRSPAHSLSLSFLPEAST